MPKWAWVSYSVKECGEQNSSGPSFHYHSSQAPNGQGRLRRVNVDLTMRKEVAYHKQENKSQHGEGDNEPASASLPPP